MFILVSSIEIDKMNIREHDIILAHNSFDQCQSERLNYSQLYSL